MGKRKRLEKKKRSTVRERDWEQHGELSFSHDCARHRRALVKLPEYAAYRDQLPVVFTANATVVSHARKWAFVLLDACTGIQDARPADDTQLCLIDERLPENDGTLMAPGDRVYVVWEEGGNPVVRGIEKRRTTLIRYAGKHGRLNQQLLAANIDLLVIVSAAAHPPFRPGLIDRFLIAAQLGGAAPMLCINKMDLVNKLPENAELYHALSLPIFPISCTTGNGIEALRKTLCNKTSVLAGHSGVGKSSLLNALDPNLRVVTREVSESTKRGKHATTASTLYQLQGGIKIIDTPGIRSLGLWNVSPEEVSFYFPEIAEVSRNCRFRDCTHTHEPDCAVRKAAETGILPTERYASYKRIRECLESE